ncbi:MAG: TIGR03085 family protein [Actinobacteria bacterium]|nr:TIGR03085 family protein [Actinomycetota bacterium]
MSRYAQDERRDLVRSYRAAPSSAPTLCPPWTAAELAAHLVLRESSARAALGALPPLRAGTDDRRRNYVAAHSYWDILDRLERGAPAWSPFAFPPLVDPLNLIEYVVHHEDLRRAAREWTARGVPIDRQRAIWRQLRTTARLSLHSAPVGVRLIWPGRADAVVRRGSDVVAVSGNPVELALFALGRQRVAAVDYDGPDDAVAALRETRIAV